MQELEHQVALFSEHTTEAGMVNYYAPGDELDNLTKALIIACFAARPFLHDSVKVVGGPLPRSNISKIQEPISLLSSELEKGDITNRGFRRRNM